MKSTDVFAAFWEAGTLVMSGYNEVGSNDMEKEIFKNFVDTANFGDWIIIGKNTIIRLREFRGDCLKDTQSTNGETL